MYILALDQRSKLILGFTIKGQSTAILPSLTVDGKLAMLPGGSKKDFYDLQKDVQNSIEHSWANCETHTCACFTSMFRGTSQSDMRSSVVWNTSGSPLKISEWDTIYTYLSKITMEGDTYWKQLEQFFRTEPRKTFVNTLIVHLQIVWNWTEFVNSALSNLKLDYHQRIAEEIVAVGQLVKL